MPGQRGEEERPCFIMQMTTEIVIGSVNEPEINMDRDAGPPGSAVDTISKRFQLLILAVLLALSLQSITFCTAAINWLF